MADETLKKKLMLQQVSIAERSDMGGVVLRVIVNCDMNLASVDELIGDLTKWRDRLAVMKEANNERK